MNKHSKFMMKAPTTKTVKSVKVKRKHLSDNDLHSKFKSNFESEVQPYKATYVDEEKDNPSLPITESISVIQAPNDDDDKSRFLTDEEYCSPTNKDKASKRQSLQYSSSKILRHSDLDHIVEESEDEINDMNTIVIGKEGVISDYFTRFGGTLRSDEDRKCGAYSSRTYTCATTQDETKAE